MDSRPIGVFDSGVGGLTVAAALTDTLPNESIVYFGDTARVPYGTKTTDAVKRYSAAIAEFLLARGVKIIVIACNTASSNAYGYLTARFDVPFVEVVTPGANAAAAATQNNRIGVIGTPRTIESGAYDKAINAFKPQARVFGKACPLFVPLAEEGWTHNAVARETARIYIEELIEKDIDTLLLACTHYPLLYDTIKEAARGINVINPAGAAALMTKTLLEERGLLSPAAGNAEHTFYVSDNCEKFGKISAATLGREFTAVLAELP